MARTGLWPPYPILSFSPSLIVASLFFDFAKNYLLKEFYFYIHEIIWSIIWSYIHYVVISQYV